MPDTPDDIQADIQQAGAGGPDFTPKEWTVESRLASLEANVADHEQAIGRVLDMLKELSK